MNKWLYIDPYIEIIFNHKMKQCLLFNVIDSKKYIFNNAEYEIIKKIIQNGHVLNILSLPDNIAISSFINTIQKKFIGGVVESIKKPIILYPILNIQEDLRKFKTLSYRDSGKNILTNLMELTINLNKINNKLVENLIYFISSAKNSSITRINIYILNYNFIDKEVLKHLFEFLKEIPILIHVYINYFDTKDFFSQYSLFLFSVKFTLNIQVEYFPDYNWKLLKDDNIRYIFTVYDEESYTTFSKIAANSKVDFLLKLNVGKANLTFLKENVFLNESEIHNIELCKRDFDANKVLNKIFFGKLIINQDKIFTRNLKGKFLGKLNTNTSIKEILYKAILR